MVDIIRLNGDLHAQTQRLLPWYVTRTLEAGEKAQVEKHLSECAECRQDLETEKAMARQVRTLPDADRGWAALKARVEASGTTRPKAALFGRRIPIGWVLMAQAASLAVLVTLLTLALSRPAAPYRTLSAAPTPASGNLIVVFNPQAPAAAVLTLLVQSQARIVDGPTATGAYVLHVAQDQRAAVLARLKSDRDVSLAEPIDGDKR